MIRTRNWFLSLFAAFVLALAGFAYRAFADPVSPASDAATAQKESLSPIAATDGFCFNATTTVSNIWSLAPSRITTNQAKIRYVQVTHSDSVNTQPVCTKVSTSSEQTANPLKCDPTGSIGANAGRTAGLMRTTDQARQFSPARDFVNSVPTPIWVITGTGTVTTCVEVAW